MELTEEMCDAIAEYDAPEPLPSHFFQLKFIDSEGEEELGDDTWPVTPMYTNCEDCMNEIKNEVESIDLTKECWNNVVEIKVVFQEWIGFEDIEEHDVVTIWERPREVLPIQPPKSAAKCDEEVESIENVDNRRVVFVLRMTHWESEMEDYDVKTNHFYTTVQYIRDDGWEMFPDIDDDLVCNFADYIENECAGHGYEGEGDMECYWEWDDESDDESEFGFVKIAIKSAAKCDEEAVGGAGGAGGAAKN